MKRSRFCPSHFTFHATLENFENAKFWKCKILKMQNFENAKFWKCKILKMLNFTRIVNCIIDFLNFPHRQVWNFKISNQSKRNQNFAVNFWKHQKRK